MRHVCPVVILPARYLIFLLAVFKFPRFTFSALSHYLSCFANLPFAVPPLLFSLSSVRPSSSLYPTAVLFALRPAPRAVPGENETRSCARSRSFSRTCRNLPSTVGILVSSPETRNRDFDRGNLDEKFRGHRETPRRVAGADVSLGSFEAIDRERLVLLSPSMFRPVQFRTRERSLFPVALFQGNAMLLLDVIR